MRRLLSSTMATPKKRQFAPLRPGADPTHLPVLKGIVFDVDGTLCLPQNYMFSQMREFLGIPKSVDILKHIKTLPTKEEEDEAMAGIKAIEREAMRKQTPQPGLRELMDYLDSRDVPKGICTRNFDQPVTHLLTKFLAGSKFEPVITREFDPPKPDPAGILHIAKTWGLCRHRANCGRSSEQDGGSEAAAEAANAHFVVGDANHLIMVGDSIDDMEAGRRAGAATVLLVNPVNAKIANHEYTDLVVKRLDELIEILETGFQGRHHGAPGPTQTQQ